MSEGDREDPAGRDPLRQRERRMGELLRDGADPAFRKNLRAAFLGAGEASAPGLRSRTGAGGRRGGAAAALTASDSSSTESGPLTPSDPNPERLRQAWDRPAAREAFRTELRESFVSGELDSTAPRPGRLIVDERLTSPWSRRVRPILFAAAAALLLAFGLRLFGPAGPPTWKVTSPRDAIAGATYEGQVLEHRASLTPGGELFAGTASLRMGLECQRGISLHAEATPGTTAFVRDARWLDDECMHSELAIEGEGELVLMTGCAGASSSVADRVEANIQTPEGNVRFLGGALSIKRFDSGLCVVLEHGRAEIQTLGNDTFSLAPGGRVFVTADGEVHDEPTFCEQRGTPLVDERLAPLDRAQADLAEGIF